MVSFFVKNRSPSSVELQETLSFFFSSLHNSMLDSGGGELSPKASPVFPNVLKTSFTKQDFVGSNITTVG